MVASSIEPATWREAPRLCFSLAVDVPARLVAAHHRALPHRLHQRLVGRAAAISAYPTRPPPQPQGLPGARAKKTSSKPRPPVT